MLCMGRTKWKSQTGRVGKADLVCLWEVTAHLPHKGKWTVIWLREVILGPSEQGTMTQTPWVWGRVPICAGGFCDPRRRDVAQSPAPGSRWARPSALPPVPRPAGGGSGADGLLAASAAAARLSALLADGPPALRARGSHSPRPAAPSPGRGGEAPRAQLPASRLPPSRSPHPAGPARAAAGGGGGGDKCTFRNDRINCV